MKTTKEENKAIDYKSAYEQAEKHRLSLEEKLKLKIKMAFLCVRDNSVEPCICYFRPATTFTKMQCRDLSMISQSKADKALFEATIIKEESDKRVFDQDNDNDDFFFAALDWCTMQNQKASAYVKKK